MRESLWSVPGIDSEGRDLIDADKETSGSLDSMFSSIPGITWQDKLDFLAVCNCCVRHTWNKPYKFSPPAIYRSRKHLRPEIGDDGRITACTCPCRHQARFICRQYGHASKPPQQLITKKDLDAEIHALEKSVWETESQQKKRKTN